MAQGRISERVLLGVVVCGDQDQRHAYGYSEAEHVCLA
jgi:hypothetical protein